MRSLPLIAAAAAAVVLTGCSSTTTGGSGDVPSKYKQTWTKQYSETTCDDWINTMSQHQMWAAAADMLTGARSADDKSAGLPSDSLVDEFEDGMTTACVIPTMSITDVGASLYVTDRVRFKP